MHIAELLIKLIRSSHSRLLLCDVESAERCRAIKTECPELEEVFVLGQFEGCTSLNRLLDDEAFPRGKI